MPFLRMPEDNTLAETLGNLGSSLGNALNPMNQLRAYDIQQQMFLRRQQLEQAQRENAAKQGAIQQWGHIVPADKLPQIAAMIYQGAPYDQVARAAAQLSGNLVDDPNAMQQNIRYIEQLTGKPYDYATQGPPVAGPNTQKAYDNWKVTQAGNTAASTALGTATGQQAATASLAGGLKDDTSPEATASNIKIMETMTGKPWDQPYAPVVGPNTQKARDTSDAARAGQSAAATKAGEVSQTPIDPTKPLMPAPGGALAPVAKPPSGDVSVSNPSAPFAVPAPVMRQTPAGVLYGTLPGETESNTTTNKARNDQLQQAMDEGATATRMKVKLAQLRDLETVASTSGVVGQVEAAAAKRLADAGIVVGDKASAYKAMDQILNTEIPDLRKGMGIQRLAQPEIQAVGKTIGSATLPPNALNNIIANEEALADVQIARRGNAQRAIGLGDQPMSFTDYTNADNELNNSLKQRADALRAQYGAIGTEAQQPPSVSTVPQSAPATPFESLWRGLSSIFSGGQAQQPAPPPPDAPPADTPPAIYQGPGKPLILIPPGQ
jgi:hypothetical protein